MPPRIGKYQLRDRIGRGGVADVWRAEIAETAELVAIKILRADVLSDSKYSEAFLMEARAHAGLTHKGIVQLQDLGVVSQEDDVSSHVGAPFLVMELANGTIERKLGVDHFGQFRDVARGLLEALAYAHARGVIHRDLKPANILKFENSYKLGDFGLAFASTDWEAPSLSLGPSAGTPRYMAPEQILGHWRDFGPWTDLYALGCVLYRLVSGHGPHDRPTPKDTCRAHLEDAPKPLEAALALPQGFESVLFKLIAKNPEERYQTAAEVIRDLELLDDSELPKLEVNEDDDLTQIQTQLESRDRSQSRRRKFRPKDTFPRESKPSHGLFGLRGIPFVGLEVERENAWKHVESMTQTGMQVVVIHGRVDAPQSGLTDWLCSRAAEEGIARVLRLMHSRIGGPREGLISLAEDSLKLWNLEGRELRTRLKEQLASHVDPQLFSHDLEVLIDALTRKEQGRVVRPLRERFRAFAHIVRSALKRGPTVLRIDHAQWSREAHGFVGYLAEEFAESSLLVIVNMSGPGEDTLSQWSEAMAGVAPVHLHVRPLDHLEMLSCVEKMVPLDALSKSSIAELAKGDARFAHALISYAHEQDLLRVSEDGFHLTSHNLPGSLEAVRELSVRSIMKSFSEEPDVQYSVELAACFGAAPDAREWRSALSINNLSVHHEILSAFANRGLIQFVGPRWHFADSLVVFALQSYARKGGRWATWNLSCAQVLQAGGTAHNADVRLRIARHLQEANQTEESVEWFKEAARAFMQSDVRTADVVLRERRAILERLKVPNHDTRMIDQQNFEAQLLHLMGNGSEARKLSLETLSFSKASRYKIGEAYATILIARTEADFGNFKESEHLMGQAFQLFGECDQEYNQCVAALGAGYAALRTSSVSQAERWFRVAIERSKDNESFAERCHSYSYLGYTYSISGRFAEARELLDQAIELARSGHSPWALWRALGMLAELERLAGNLGRARELFLEVLQWHTLLKSPPYRVFETHVNLAMVALRERNFAEVMSYVDLASKGGHWTGQIGHAWLVEMTRALCTLGKGDLDKFDSEWRYAISLIDPELVDTDLVWLLETALEIGGDPEFESQCSSMLEHQKAALKTRLTT